jgi:non-heme chloroperoxidase
MPQIKSVDLPTGVTLQYAEHGDPSGTPVLLLHGFSDSWYSFELLMRYLPSDIRALALTQRGHGDSSRPEKDYRPAHFAADATAFLDALDVHTAVVVGHSMGSVIAQRLAIDHPGRISALCLVGAFHSLANSEAAQGLAGVVEQMEDPVDPDFVREFQRSSIIRPVPQAFFETVVQESMKMPARVWKDVAACMADDFSSELHKITAPTWLVWGDQDGLVPRSDQDAQLEAIADSRLEVYEGTGHAVHWEQPERFAKGLVNFIEGSATRR